MSSFDVRSTGGHHRRRGGLTLLELLLVLSLLVVIGALVAPSVGVTLGSNRLRSSAELVQARLAKARVEAMASGRTHIFLYQPSGAAFVVETWYSHDDYLESDELTSLGPGQAPATALGEQASSSSEKDRLPEGITFVSSQTADDPRAEQLMQSSPAGALQLAGGDWSSPIFFYPDGTTSTARLVLANERERFIVLTLRGLTGVVRVGAPTSRLQLQ